MVLSLRAKAEEVMQKSSSLGLDSSYHKKLNDISKEIQKTYARIQSIMEEMIKEEEDQEQMKVSRDEVCAQIDLDTLFICTNLDEELEDVHESESHPMEVVSSVEFLVDIKDKRIQTYQTAMAKDLDEDSSLKEPKNDNIPANIRNCSGIIWLDMTSLLNQIFPMITVSMNQEKLHAEGTTIDAFPLSMTRMLDGFSSLVTCIEGRMLHGELFAPNRLSYIINASKFYLPMSYEALNKMQPFHSINRSTDFFEIIDNCVTLLRIPSLIIIFDPGVVAGCSHTMESVASGPTMAILISVFTVSWNSFQSRIPFGAFDAFVFQVTKGTHVANLIMVYGPSMVFQNVREKSWTHGVTVLLHSQSSLTESVAILNMYPYVLKQEGSDLPEGFVEFMPLKSSPTTLYGTVQPGITPHCDLVSNYSGYQSNSSNEFNKACSRIIAILEDLIKEEEALARTDGSSEADANENNWEYENDVEYKVLMPKNFDDNIDAALDDLNVSIKQVNRYNSHKNLPSDRLEASLHGITQNPFALTFKTNASEREELRAEIHNS